MVNIFNLKFDVDFTKHRTIIIHSLNGYTITMLELTV